MGNTEKVKEAMTLSRKPRTCRELMAKVGLEQDQFCSVASIMVNFVARGLVEKHEPRVCEVTGRRAYTYKRSATLKLIQTRETRKNLNKAA